MFGVLFPQIAKHGVPFVPFVFAFITFTGALKSQFRDVANVFKTPWALLIVMVLLHLVIPGVACGLGNLIFPDNSNLITGIVLEFAVPTAVVSLMWVTIYSGNNAMSLALVVIEHCSGTVFNTGDIACYGWFKSADRCNTDDAATYFYGGIAGGSGDDIKPMQQRKSTEGTAIKTGTRFPRWH